MSHSQFRHIELILRHAWLNLQVKHMLLAGSTRLLPFWVEIHRNGQRFITKNWAARGLPQLASITCNQLRREAEHPRAFSPREGPYRSPKKAYYRPDRGCLCCWYCTSTKRISTTTPLPRLPLAQGLPVMGHIVVRRTIWTGLQRLISVFNDFDAFHSKAPDLGFCLKFYCSLYIRKKRFGTVTGLEQGSQGPDPTPQEMPRFARKAVRSAQNSPFRPISGRLGLLGDHPA
jgi:hypothetical protein